MEREREREIMKAEMLQKKVSEVILMHRSLCLSVALSVLCSAPEKRQRVPSAYNRFIK